MARPFLEEASSGPSRGEDVGAVAAPRSPSSPPPLPPPSLNCAADAWGAVEFRGKWTRTPATVSWCIGPGDLVLVERRRPVDAPVGSRGAAAHRATHPRPPVGSARREDVGGARTWAAEGAAVTTREEVGCPGRRVSVRTTSTRTASDSRTSPA